MRGRLVFEFAPGAALPIEARYMDLDLQLRVMEEAGIDAVVSSPASIGVDELPISEAEHVAALLNEEQAAAEVAHPGRFYGLATLPLGDTDAALRVLSDGLERLHLRGVYMHSNIAGQPLDAPGLLPVFAELEKRGTPIFLHPTRSIFADRLPRFGLEYVLGYPFDTTVAALSLVFGGVLDRFPSLKVVHPHLGATVPFLAGRIDFEYRQPWAFARELQRPPSEYLRTFWVDTVARNPGALRLAAEFYGIEKILLGTDYPWWPAGDAVGFVTSSLPVESAASVLGSNACALLRIVD